MAAEPTNKNAKGAGRGKGKGNSERKVIPVHTIKAYRRRRGLDLIVNLCARRRSRLHAPAAFKVKVKQSHYRPLGFQEAEAPRFQDNRHMKVIRLSALAPAASTLYEIFLVLISVRG